MFPAYAGIIIAEIMIADASNPGALRALCVETDVYDGLLLMRSVYSGSRLKGKEIALIA